MGGAAPWPAAASFIKAASNGLYISPCACAEGFALSRFLSGRSSKATRQRRARPAGECR